MKSFVVSLIKLESSDIMWLLSLQSVQSTPANQSLSTESVQLSSPPEGGDNHWRRNRWRIFKLWMNHEELLGMLGINTNTTLATAADICEGGPWTLPFSWRLTRSGIFIACSHLMTENFLTCHYCEHYVQAGWNTKSILVPVNNLPVSWVADPSAKPNPQQQIHDKLAINVNQT